MIGFLQGKIEFRDDPYIFLNVNGVGYKILVTRDVFASDSNKQIMVFTYSHIRQDTFDLFGFLHFEDLKIFQKLIGVSGVGPKTAINIFSVGSRNEILEAIETNNVDFFTSVPRLGKKNAQKIIIELKSKFLQDLDFEKSDGANSEVASALKNMGFAKDEVQAALKGIKSDDASIEEKIKLSLKYLAKK